jgi:hypothetical protein
MESEGGALKFEALLDTEQLEKMAQEAENRVKGFSKAAVDEGAKIDDAFKITADNIRIQKDVIASLESEVKRLEAEIAKMAPGKAQAEMITQTKQVKAELEGEKEALKTLEQEVKKTESAHVSFRTQLRNAREELIRMEQAGLRGTEAYSQLQQKVGQLQDAYDDATQQARVLASDEKVFQGIVSGLGGVAGAFSTAQGAVGLFAGENENLQKIMLKVQSLMSITIGLQQIEQALNKDSAFQLVVVAKAKELLAAANLKLATALGISTVAAKALMATLTLGLSVAITGVILLISKYVSKQAEARKETDAFNKSVVENAYKAMASVEELSLAWSKLGDSVKAKEKFLDDNKKKFDDLGVAVRGVKDAEKLLIDNKDKFVEAIVLRAKALASAELASAKYKEAMEKQMKLENTPKTIQKSLYASLAPGKTYITGVIETENPKYTKLKKESDKLQEEGTKLIAQQVEFTAQEKAILAELGVSSNQIIEGSIDAVEKSISKLKEKYKEAATDKERNAILKQIREQEKLLTKMDFPGDENLFKTSLEKKKKLYTEYFKWINSNDPSLQKAAQVQFAGLLKEGSSYIEYLKAQKDKILSLSSQTAEQKAQLKTLNDAIADETKKTVLQEFEEALKKQLDSATSVLQMLDIIAQKRKELTGDNSDLDTGKKEILDEADKDTSQKVKEEQDALLEEYAGYLGRKLALERKFTEDMILLQKRLDEAKTPEETVKVKEAIDNRKERYVKESKVTGDEDYDKMVEEYRNFEQKKQAIVEEFTEKRKKALEFGNTDLAAELDKAREEALSDLSVNEIMASPDWAKLFSDLDEVSARELQKLKERLEDAFKELKDLSPEALKGLTDHLDRASDTIKTKNPFLALSEAIKKYKQTGDKVDFKEVLFAASASVDRIKGYFDAVTGSLDKMGISVDEQTQQVINDIDGIMQGASDLAMGLATDNPLQIVQGTVSVISNGIDLIAGAKDRKLERSIQRHKEAVEALKTAYEDLERAVDKALGTEVYKNQQDAIKNLKAQQQEYLQMIQDERAKKKTDNDKIKEYQQAIKDAGYEIDDILEEIAQDILQTNAKDFADQLGDAIVEAFSKGEDAAKAWGDVVNNVMKEAIINQLKKNFLEKQLDAALQNLESYMGAWDSNGNFIFDELTDAEKAAFQAQIDKIAANFNAALGAYSDLFKTETDTSLTGAVKGITTEQASVIGGQLNAVRINQVDGIEVMRQQLFALSEIAANTRYNRFLESIDRRLSDMGTDTLRSQGMS